MVTLMKLLNKNPGWNPVPPGARSTFACAMASTLR